MKRLWYMLYIFVFLCSIIGCKKDEEKFDLSCFKNENQEYQYRSYEWGISSEDFLESYSGEWMLGIESGSYLNYTRQENIEYQKHQGNAYAEFVYNQLAVMKFQFMLDAGDNNTFKSMMDELISYYGEANDIKAMEHDTCKVKSYSWKAEKTKLQFTYVYDNTVGPSSIMIAMGTLTDQKSIDEEMESILSADDIKTNVEDTLFEIKQSVIDYGNRRFYRKSGTETLYMKEEKETPLSDNLISGNLVAKGDKLYYVVTDDEMHRVMELNMDTLQAVELFSRPIEMIEDEIQKTFTLEGTVGDYLVFKLREPRNVDNSTGLYSFNLKSKTEIALSKGDKTNLDGIGEYIISIHSEAQMQGILYTYVLTVDKLDGSESWEVADFCTGAEISNGILYYIEWINGEQYLISYDLDAGKELNSQRLETGENQEWESRYNCFYCDGTGILFMDGTVYEDSSNRIFKVGDQYFVSGAGNRESDMAVYSINTEDKSLIEIENLVIESKLWLSELSLHNGRVYMTRTGGSENEVFSWEQSVFGIE